jgi:hypothetical protein
MAATGALTAPSVLHAAPPAAQHIVALPDAGGLMEDIFPHVLAVASPGSMPGARPPQLKLPASAGTSRSVGPKDVAAGS